MKWIYSIRNKRKLSLLLMAIVGVVLLNHYQEKSNANKLRGAMAAIYKDRLMVEGYIYSISLNLSQMRTYLQEDHPESTNQLLIRHIERIDRLTSLFLETQLTVAEEQHLRHLIGTVETINGSLSTTFSEAEMEAYINLALEDLQKLSSIQLEEGELILSQTEKIFHSGERFAQLEMVALVLILILVQTLIISARVFGGKPKLPYNLN